MRQFLMLHDLYINNNLRVVVLPDAVAMCGNLQFMNKCNYMH